MRKSIEEIKQEIYLLKRKKHRRFFIGACLIFLMIIGVITISVAVNRYGKAISGLPAPEDYTWPSVTEDTFLNLNSYASSGTTLKVIDEEKEEDQKQVYFNTHIQFSNTGRPIALTNGKQYARFEIDTKIIFPSELAVGIIEDPTITEGSKRSGIYRVITENGKQYVDFAFDDEYLTNKTDGVSDISFRVNAYVVQGRKEEGTETKVTIGGVENSTPIGIFKPRQMEVNKTASHDPDNRNNILWKITINNPTHKDFRG